MPAGPAVTALLLAALWLAGGCAPEGAQPGSIADSYYADATDAGLVREGREIYAMHCASCHGVALEGEENWRRRKPSGRMPAPPHDASGHTWHHPDWELFMITRDGISPLAPPDYESDMPAFGGVLTDQEILAVIAYIKAQWPADIAAVQQDINRRAPPDDIRRR